MNKYILHKQIKYSSYFGELYIYAISQRWMTSRQINRQPSGGENQKEEDRSSSKEWSRRSWMSW